MGGPGLVRALVALGATAGMALGIPVAAQADETVVVRGTAFPDAGAQLAYVGCTDLLAPDAGGTQQVLQPYIGRGPGRAPAGARSLGYDLDGGTAIGSQHVVSSMAATTTASLSVFAPKGSQGLAVAGYQEPADAGSQLIWFGTAPVTAPAGVWHTVEATKLAYTWTKYDMTTRTPVLAGEPDPAQTVPRFAAAHGGDGAGLYSITFGCDGAPFSMDAMRIGSPGQVTTYDIEGLTTSLSMTASSFAVTAGEEVTLRGTLRTSTGGRIPSATVILERRTTIGQPWETIRVVPAGHTAVARITPARTALYRWRFVDRPLAEGTVSQPFLVTVLPHDAAEPTPTPTPTPTPEPTPTPTPIPTPTLPPPPSDTPTPEPTEPEDSPTPSASDQPSPDATPLATPDATPSATPDEGAAP